MWGELRNRRLNGYKFARQIPIGPYIVDFVCRDVGLVVELDGSQHAEDRSDEKRDAFLNREGYSVLRFWNHEVLRERRAVLDTILAALDGRLSPSPGLRFAPATLSPRGRGIRGARASDGAKFLNQARSVLLPLGEKVARPQGETDEGAFTTGNTA